ncbi:hypothetical protein KKE26_12815 [bacterium]|nr:hypothetical protein [bacterium]MBU1752613.1 hypothetical protein [bacterium]
MATKFTVSLLSGILCSLSLISGLDFLIWFGLVPLLAIKSMGALENVILGYSSGIIFFAAISYGIIPDHFSGFLFYTFVVSLFFPIFTLILWFINQSLTTKENFLMIKLFAPPIIWVSMEYIFLNLFSIPFNLGLQQYRHPWVIQAASITGIYGVSFLIVLVNSNLALWWRCWQENRGLFKNKQLLLALGITLLMIIVNGICGWWLVEKDVSQTKHAINIVGIQGNIPEYQYRLAPVYPEYIKAVREKYFKMINKARELQADIIVLPEGATCNYNFRIPMLRDEIYRLAIDTKSLLLFGSLDLDENGKVYNSSFVVSSTGRLMGRYDKVKLAPFGEGIICSGKDSDPIPTQFGKLGQMICWESVFPQVARRITKKGAGILFILTNDGDFRISTLPVLHAAEAIFRAVENGRWVVRVANFGISMVISPKGIITTKIGLGNEGIMQTEMECCEDKTVYAKVGDMFSWLCLFLAIFIVRVPLTKKSPQQVKDSKALKWKLKPVWGSCLSQLKQPVKLGIIVIAHCLTMAIVIVFSILAVGHGFQPEYGMKKHLAQFFSSPRIPIEEVQENFLQARSNTCGPAALAHLLNLWSVETSEQEIIKLVKMEKRGTSMYELVQAARKLGFSAWGEEQNFAALKKTILPIIAFISNNHWVVVLEIKEGFITLFDPAMGYIKVREGLFNMAWNGYVMLVRTKPIIKSLKLEKDL